MKQLFLVLSLCSPILLRAQTFLSVSATTKGEGFSIGYLEKRSGIEFSAGYNVHIVRADVPTIFNISLGKRILLGHKEKDNFSITPSIGYANYMIKDFSNYEKDEVYGSVKQLSEYRPIYGLELGKDWHIGRLFVNANYCNKPFWGIGIRAFFR